jgi:hypothetical protein
VLVENTIEEVRQCFVKTVAAVFQELCSQAVGRGSIVAQARSCALDFIRRYGIGEWPCLASPLWERGVPSALKEGGIEISDGLYFESSTAELVAIFVDEGQAFRRIFLEDSCEFKYGPSIMTRLDFLGHSVNVRLLQCSSAVSDLVE